ncbi:hypothetical protein Pan181_35880 [Aeoliella mucimassa]|uniref:Helix-turn-helix domain protein n=1 Tax=Aeoliella mucimassa TaxID=2527972 RepID=A0A518ARL4_9BACT|nr:hypothetical protein Pan181_35880 [Aeoliella mucimassa]
MLTSDPVLVPRLDLPRRLNRSISTIDRMIAAGTLPAVRIGTAVFVNETDVVRVKLLGSPVAANWRTPQQ